MRGGTYTGVFTSMLVGEENKRVVIRQYPDEEPIIDGSLEIWGNGYVELHIPTIINSTVYRGTDQDPSPANERPAGLNLLAPHSLYIGGTILDTGVSIGYWALAYDSILYGTLCLNGGWVDDLRGHGHGIYAQNATGNKYIKRCFFGPHFGRTQAVYGKGAEEDEPHISGFRIIENSFIERMTDSGSQLLMGGNKNCRLDDNVFDSNHAVGAMVAQYLNPQSGSIEITNNTFWSRSLLSALTVGYWEEPTITGNVVNGKSPINDVVIKEMVRYSPPTGTSSIINVWDNNEYHYLGDEPDMFRVSSDADYRYDFDEWKTNTGFDATSTYDTIDTLPDAVYCYPNEYKDQYDKSCGMIVIWNGSSGTSVSVDISSMNLVVGGQYNLIQALDPLADIETFTYSSGTINIDMRQSEHTVAIPLGWDVPLTDNPFPRFGTFFIREV